MPQEPQAASRLVLPASLALLAIYFAVSAAGGLHAYFTQDDAGNLLTMHRYFEHSILSELGSAVQVVTPAYRPLGGLYYFTLYRLAGFNPLPFRAVCLALMLGNVWLAFSLLRRLSGSLEAGLLGAILMANHPAVLELLYSSGTIYEILCFLFYFLTVRWYLIWRQAGLLSWKQMAAILALTACALDSKEMAMTLPGALALVEVIYFARPCRSWRAPLAAAALVLPTLAVKVLTRNPLSEDPHYASHSFHSMLEGMRAYQGFLLYGNLFGGRLSAAGLVALWVAMLGLALLLRSRAMKFGLLFLIGSLLPVCLIERRGGYMLYIPLLGWALYVASLFQHLLEGLIGLIPRRHRVAQLVKVAAFVAFAMLIVKVHSAKLAPYSSWYRRDQNDMRRIIDRLLAVHPQLPPGSRLLLLDDPLPGDYALLLLARMAYGDPALEVDRMKMLPQAPVADELIRYDHVLSRRMGGSRRARHRGWQGAFGSAVERACPRDFRVHRNHCRPGHSRHHRPEYRTGCFRPGSAAPERPGLQVRWVRPSGGRYWLSANTE